MLKFYHRFSNINFQINYYHELNKSNKLSHYRVIMRYFSNITDENKKDDNIKNEKLSKTMRIYLERAKEHDEFLKNQNSEYIIGKRHLANMMGEDPELFTQEQVDEAIKYLFPSGLFNPRARPLLKPPSEIFPKIKAAAFDKDGKPFHHLFYTGKPNFYSLQNEIVSHLKSLNDYEDEIISKGVVAPTEHKMELLGSEWLKHEQLESRVLEKLATIEYEQWISAMDRLWSHPYSSRVTNFLTQYRHFHMKKLDSSIVPEIKTDDQGREIVEIKDCFRKTARGSVTLYKPGTGKLTINGKNIDYFTTTYAKESIIFPLVMSGLINKVDIEATVEKGGPSSQAGAVRYGISHALTPFLSEDKIEELRIAGLLQKDFRTKERKKPGQEGARRKYTWKKR